MEFINSAMFEGLSSLRYLDLTTNRVTNIEEAFVDLVSLEQLNMRDNLLPRLTTKSFTGLYKVQYLNLDSNRITSIEVGTFQFLTNLARLIVSNNPFTTLSRLDFFGSRLQYIDVSKVGLQRVPQSLTRYVRDLRLAKNNLTHIRLGDLDSYPYLGLLVLDDNSLVDIESDALGRQEYLARLWLNGNRLQQIPANLPPSLKVLYVEENLLRTLPAYSFQGLINLEQLFLQRNQIKRLDFCAFCDLTNLRHLDLQANLLEALNEGVFANLTSLLNLDLSQNPLTVLPAGCFSGLEVLKTLQLSRMKSTVQFDGSVFNPLKHLETLEIYDSSAFASRLVNSTRALQGLRNVRELNLMHNNLVALRSDFPNFFPQLKVIKLSGNLWQCDKNIFWLTEWIKRGGTHFYHSYGIRCSKPDQLLYKPIMTLTEDDVVPQPHPTIPASSTAKTTPLFSLKLIFNLTDVTAKPHTTRLLNSTSTEKITTATPRIRLGNISSITTPITDFMKSTSTSFNITDRALDGFTPKPELVILHRNSTPLSTNVVLPTTSVYATTQSITTIASVITSNKPLRPASLSTSTTADDVLSTTPSSTTSFSENVGIIHPKETSTAFAKQEPGDDDWVVNASSIIDVATLQSNDQMENVTAATELNITTNKTEYNNEPGVLEDINNSNRLSDQSSHLHNGIKDNDDNVIVAAASVATGVGLLLMGMTLSYFLFRCRKRYYPIASSTSGNLSLTCQMRRSSSSISYSPQRDEVSIVTVSEGTVGLRTLTHQGLSNKLYFVLENGTDPSSQDIVKDSLPDPSLCELLPDTYPSTVHCGQKRNVPHRSISTYCFTK